MSFATVGGAAQEGEEMTTPDDVLALFQQLYQAEQQLAVNTERERMARIEYETATADRKEADEQLVTLRERMQRLARRAAGVPEPEPPQEARAEYRPIARRPFSY